MATAPTMTIRVDRKGLKKLKALARRLEKVSVRLERTDNTLQKVAVTTGGMNRRQLQKALEMRDGEITSLNRRLEGADSQIRDAWNYCDALKTEVIRKSKDNDELKEQLKETEEKLVAMTYLRDLDRLEKSTFPTKIEVTNQ